MFDTNRELYSPAATIRKSAADGTLDGWNLREIILQGLEDGRVGHDS
jgi:hypothetical protein